ncbi:hypothetical protein WJX77_001578 [Trebouxia sp. C0004]
MVKLIFPKFVRIALLTLLTAILVFQKVSCTVQEQNEASNSTIRDHTHLQDCMQRTLLAASDISQSFLAHLDRNIPAVCIVTVVGALSTAAGAGGGALFVPLFNSLLEFSVKDSAAISQAIITGGAIAVWA